MRNRHPQTSICDPKKGKILAGKLKIKFKLLRTVEEVDQNKRLLLFLSNFLPKSCRDLDHMEIFRSLVGELSLVYAEELLVGLVIIEFSKKSAELHGIARPDLRDFYGPRLARKILETIYGRIFTTIFDVEKKKKVIAKVPPDALGAMGFLRRFGFERMDKTDVGRQLFKLTREKYEQTKAESNKG